MHSTEIKLENIGFTHPDGSRPLYNNLNLCFSEGRAGLVGDNGSGKTTLFQIMVGLAKPTSGRVLFNNVPLTKDKDFAELRRHVGMVFQNADDQLFSPTVLEDVAFGPLNLKYSPQEAKRIALDTLERIGLSGYGDRVTHRLSGGEKRLVALATVLAMKPDILLLDEPTNDLDRDSRLRLIDILNDIEQSFLIISHDHDFLCKLVSDFYQLEKGQLFQSNNNTPHHHHHAHPLGEREHVHADNASRSLK